MLRLVVGLVVALAAGCSLLPPPAGIQVTIPATPDIPALPVTIVDHAGIVSDAAPGEPANDVGSGTIVRAIPGRDDMVQLTWIGGACDDRAIVTIDPTADRYRVSVQAQSSAMACSAVGIIRSVALTLNEPVGAGVFEPS